jgi:hypothetical protein
MLAKLRNGLRGSARRNYRKVKRLAGFLQWTCRSLAGLWTKTPAGERRLLAVYDLSTQPFSIGDILAIQEAALVLREEHQLAAVDFALVYDPQRPACADPAFNKINAENVLYHLASVLPAAQVNPHHGSLFVFDSHRHLQRFIADNADLYLAWPPAWKFAEGNYLYYHVTNDLLYDFHQKHGRIPRLSCRPFLEHWAQTFFAQHVRPHVPVTVQIRNNKGISPRRNSRLECWLEFFRHCERDYPVRFIVVCALAEVDERLRRHPNVLIAKDYGTTIEQDLALIHEAAIHLGASSGPGMMAIYGAKPYLLVNTDLIPDLYRGMIREDNAVRFFFSTPQQRLTLGEETIEVLRDEFARLWQSVEPADWRSPSRSSDRTRPASLTWLR